MKWGCVRISYEYCQILLNWSDPDPLYNKVSDPDVSKMPWNVKKSFLDTSIYFPFLNLKPDPDLVNFWWIGSWWGSHKTRNSCGECGVFTLGTCWSLLTCWTQHICLVSVNIGSTAPLGWVADPEPLDRAAGPKSLDWVVDPKQLGVVAGPEPLGWVSGPELLGWVAGPEPLNWVLGLETLPWVTGPESLDWVVTPEPLG